MNNNHKRKSISEDDENYCIKKNSVVEDDFFDIDAELQEIENEYSDLELEHQEEDIEEKLMEDFSNNPIFKLQYTSDKPFWTDKSRLDYVSVHALQKLATNACVVERYSSVPVPIHEKVIMWTQTAKMDVASLKSPVKLAGEIIFKGQLTVKPALEQLLSECLNKNVNCIIIPYSIWGYSIYDTDKDEYTDIYVNQSVRGLLFDSLKRIGHKVLVIINKQLKTVEFFDSNGTTGHEELFGNYDYELLKEYLLNKFGNILSEYTFLTYADVCPEFSFQYYEQKQMESKSENELKGYCIFWSIFTAHMRLTYPHIQPKIILNALMKFFQTQEPRYLHDFIKHYALYLETLI